MNYLTPFRRFFLTPNSIYMKTLNLKYLSISVLLLAIGILLGGCQAKSNQKTTIAISKETPNYTQWLLRNNNNLHTINLYGMSIDSATQVLATCNGLLLTGGEDVYPAFYNKESDTLRCGGFDRYRDSLEMAMIAFALNHNMPVMGICRGEQILNVALGGSLIIDIPGDFDTTVVHRQDDWMNCFHVVEAVNPSALTAISHATLDTVTSNHHQAIDQPAPPLMICAYAADSLPEAVTWLHPEGKGFLMAVQWHPERMPTHHPFSDPLAAHFLKEASKYQPETR